MPFKKNKDQGKYQLSPELEASTKKKSLFAKLRGMKISVQFNENTGAATPVTDDRSESGASAEADALPIGPPAPNADGDEAPAPKKGKKEKKKKEPKKKAEKKPKAKKAKKTKNAKHKEGAGSKKKLLLIIVLALVVVGGGLSAFLLLGGEASPEDRLAKAQKYNDQGKFDNAAELFTGLIGEDELLREGSIVADAYLGLSDTLVATDEVEVAIEKLEMGYTMTGDTRLLDRFAELGGVIEEDGEPGAPQTPADQPISWSDPEFERMVRLALSIPAGQDIRPSDLTAVTELKILGSEHAIANMSGSERNTLHAFNSPEGYELNGELYTERGSITSLADVAHFPNLTRLTVGYNQVRDLSGITGLRSLNMLGLYANEITDLSALRDLPALDYLSLFGNNISDLSPLSDLPALTVLTLQYNQVTDVSPLAGISTLEELYMNYNAVSDISSLAPLQSLRFLFLRDNQVSDISAVARMSGLTDIDFSGNPVSDYAPALNIQNVNRG